VANGTKGIGKPDSDFVRVDTLNHILNVAVTPLHAIDTVMMQITGKTQDVLLFETSTIGQCCPRLVLNSVLYNGSEVYTLAKGPSVAILLK